MDNSEFRLLLHEVAEWMADYALNVRGMPVAPAVKPGDVKASLPASPPEEGSDFKEIFSDFREKILPGMTHWNHPGWFAYFPANTSPPSILAEMITAAIGAQCMSWATSPAATELEQVVMDWLRILLGLPAEFRGVIQDTASTSTFVALLSARERATDGAFNRSGAAAPGAARLSVYASAEAHSSVEKGVKLAGFGLERFRRIGTDSSYAMRPDLLMKAMDEDAASGLAPACVVATVGTTSSTAIDPLDAIGDICRSRGAWLHVDAAYAGSAAILPEKRYILKGVEKADSFVFNPHKWLFTNFDCSAYFVRDVPALLRTFSMNPEYLKTAHDQTAVNFRDWGIQLGRRFRALKLWFVLRSYGAEGLRSVLRRHIAMADDFRRSVESNPDFEVLAPAPFGLVCFRYKPKGLADGPELDMLNEKLLAAVNSTGRVHLTHTRLGGNFAVRMSIGQLETAREDVDAAYRLFVEKAGELHVQDAH